MSWFSHYLVDNFLGYPGVSLGIASQPRVRTTELGSCSDDDDDNTILVP